MSKKSLISTLILGLVVTLALGIYTIVSVFGGTNPLVPRNDAVRLAYLVGDEVDVFKDYSKENITFKSPDNAAMPIKETETAGVYTAETAGEVVAVVKLDRVGHTDQYNTITYTIVVYNPGSGTVDDPRIVPNANHLAKLRDEFNSSLTATAPEYVKLGGDIDLGNENWEPIGWEGHPYTGNIDGAGFSILNLKISVTKADLVEENSKFAREDGNSQACVNLGLFGAIKGNTISNLNFGAKDGTGAAQITISADALEALTATYETTYTKFVRLAVGVVAGYAQNADIVGGLNEEEQIATSIASTITGYSYTDAAANKAHGMGGVVGVGTLVRVSNLKVTSVVVNNNESYAKGSNIGGVVGYLNSTTSLSDTVITKELKNKIDNVDVTFTASGRYYLQSTIGGVVGYGWNADIVNSKVSKFSISDSTDKANVNYDDSTPVTVAGGVVGRLVSANQGADFVSSIADVNVENVDAYMLGGQISGVAYVIGSVGNDADKTTIKDVTVQGTIQADDAAGVVYQVRPNASVQYTKAFETPVIDVTLKGHRNGGVAIYNNGSITGFVSHNEPSEDAQEEALVETKTAIKVVVNGMGADPTDGQGAEALYILRTTSIAAGIAVYNDPELGLTEKATVIPEISNFEVEMEGNASFVANVVVGSANYAGVAYEVGNAKVTGVVVKSAKFTSAHGQTSNGGTFSSTYSVAGLVNFANAGADIENNEVQEILVNKDVDKTIKFGAAYVGGLVSRYTGDENGTGLTLSGNKVLKGEMYFNANDFYKGAYSADDTVVEIGIFTAGGLVGALSKYEGNADSEYADSLDFAVLGATHIENNEVSNLTITADFAEEAATLSNKTLGEECYRARALGATIGLINSETANFNISTNKVSKVVIAAYQVTFTYSFGTGANQEPKYLVSIGCRYNKTYGMSYYYNTDDPNNVVDVADYASDNEEQIAYQQLGA